MSYLEDVHRHFLRTIMNKGALDVGSAWKVIQSIPEGVGEDLDKIIGQINKVIQPMQQQIKVVTDELSHKKVYVFLNLIEDGAALAQNFFSKEDLEYFKYLLEEIITAEPKKVSGIHAINISTKVKTKTLSKMKAQKLLDNWSEICYLRKKSNGHYILGSRAIHEFDSYIKTCFQNFVESCFLCKRLVFNGIQCTSCGEHLHSHCQNKYLEKVSKWPCCKTVYVEPQEINNQSELENEVTVIDKNSSSSSDETIVNTQNSSRSTRKRKHN